MADTKQTTASGGLSDFNFDTDQSWFGVKDETTEQLQSQVIKEVKGADKIVADGGKTATQELPDDNDDEEEGNEVTFFETPEEEAERKKAKKATPTTEDDEEAAEVEIAEDGEGEDEKNKSAEGDEKFFSTLAGEMKDKGIFQNVEIKPDEEITEEKFFELQDAEIEARVQETFEAFYEGMPKDGVDFIKFVKAGGNPADFFAAYNSSFDYDSIDLDNQSHVDQVLTNYLSTQEHLDANDIADRIKWLKESGKDKIYADKYVKAGKKADEARKANLVKSQEEAAEKREQEREKFQKSLGEVLAKTENVGAFSFTKEDQKELNSYINKLTVKVGKNKYVPAFQAEMANIFKAETEENKQKLLLLAKLVKSNFDVTDLVTATQTKVVKKAKSALADVKKGIKPSSAGAASNRKTLSDYFG